MASTFTARGLASAVVAAALTMASTVSAGTPYCARMDLMVAMSGMADLSVVPLAGRVVLIAFPTRGTAKRVSSQTHDYVLKEGRRRDKPLRTG